MNPINGIRLWPQFDTLPIMPPSWTTPKRGRKQKKQRKQADENVTAHSQGIACQEKRKGINDMLNLWIIGSQQKISLKA